MQSLQFAPGNAYLASDSAVAPWRVVFEDEGVAGYFYAVDRSGATESESILDAMLLYNVAVLTRSHRATGGAPRERLAAVEWSRSGLKAVLYLDGTPQALFDFEARRGYCRLNFPNFLDESGSGWRRSSHAWDDTALERFETALYV